jgi:serine-type D-Ala-D-Ala carboxypeptidase/endopeptidase (penicillin-binding protein 4)
MSSRSSAALVALACSAVVSAQAPAPPSPAALAGLQHDIDAILTQPAFAHGFWGVLVQPVTGGAPWYAMNADKLMTPASTMKIVTLAAAAERLGWDYRFETRLFAGGPVSDGVLHGDLIVVGGGDPNIDDWDGAATRTFADWAAQLQAAGIRAIEGRIVGDDNLFDDDELGAGWSVDDVAAGFSAGVSALQFNEGNAQVRVAPGMEVGERAMVSIATPSSGMTLTNLITTSTAGSPGGITRRRLPGISRLELRGSMPLHSRPFLLNVSVDNPTLYFARALRAGLIAAGIDIPRAAVDVDDLMAPPARVGAPLATFQSPPLSMLATTMMKLSQNQFAEAFFKTLGAGSGQGTADSARAAVQSILSGWNLPAGGLVQVDGSGLSRFNYVTPDTLVAILRHVDRDERLRSAYEATLPIAGRDGTIEARMKGTAAEGNALVKTGSMTGVRAMAGYVRTADGETLAFAILANNFENGTNALNAASDAIVVRLATFSR